MQVYQRVLDLAARAMEHRDPLVTRVSVPYEGTTLPAYYSQAPATAEGPAPVIILWNGLDSTKEHMYISSHWAELAARGISCLSAERALIADGFVHLAVQNHPRSLPGSAQ